MTLPRGWTLRPLKEIARVKSGFAFPSSAWRTEGIPVVKIANVRHGRVDLSGCSYIDESQAARTSDFAVNNGDLLITLTGEIGAVGIYESSQPARLNQRVGRLDLGRPDLVDLRYLRLALEGPVAREAMWAGAKGMAQPNISPRQVEALEIPLPPIEEQLKILEMTGTYFSQIDVAEGLMQAVEKRIAALRGAVRLAALAGRLSALPARQLEGDVPPSV
jgi:type I restriction enzyme S subunit